MSEADLALLKNTLAQPETPTRFSAEGQAAEKIMERLTGQRAPLKSAKRIGFLGFSLIILGSIKNALD